MAALQFKNNALGVIYGTTASYPGQFRRLEITGTKGTIVLVENSLTVWKFAEMNDEDEQIIKKYGNIEGGGGVADPAAISFMGHAKNMAAFLDALEAEKKFEIDGAEARKAVSIILDMYESASKQIVIKK